MLRFLNVLCCGAVLHARVFLLFAMRVILIKQWDITAQAARSAAQPPVTSTSAAVFVIAEVRPSAHAGGCRMPDW